MMNVTVKTNYFDGGGISYAAADLIAPFASLLTNGVFGVVIGALQVLAHSPANLSVDVQAGSCLINGYYVKNDAVVNVPIGANTSGYNRIDNIVANVDTANKITTIIDIQGIPSSSPVAPAVGSNQLLLAQVLVGNNISVLNQNIITDSRVNVDLFGSQLASFMNYCYARSSVSISLADSAYTAIPLNTNMNDPQNMHSATTNNTRIIIPKSGNYAINGIIVFASNSTGRREACIRLNGGDYIAVNSAPADNANQGVTVSAIQYLNAGDYIELCGLQTSGAALNALIYYNCAPSVSVQRIGG